MDLLFATPSPFVWDMEANFARLKAEHTELGHVTGGVANGVLDVSDKKDTPADSIDQNIVDAREKSLDSP
jgi:hypothetical protein